MKQVEYTDKSGRKTRVLLPDDAPDSNAPMGIVIGPPDLSSLKLPKEIEIRLHNNLYDRGILTKEQAVSRRLEVFAAWQHALRVDVGAIVDLYQVQGRVK